MKSNFFNKFYKNIFLDKYDTEYINFNYNIFNKPKLNKKVLLSELDWRESDIIGSSFLIDRILRKYKAELACFSPNLTTGFFNRLKKIFFKFTNRKIYKINKSLGVNSFIFPTLSKKQEKKSRKIFLSIKKKN